MKKLLNVLAVLLVVAISGFMMAGACEDVIEDGVCGPCGKIKNGDATISGNAELDGIFKAVGTLKLRTGSIKADFDGQVRAMAEGVFGIDVEGKSTADLVAEIKTEFAAQITAHIEGDLKVNYQAPKCEANVDVAVQAQAQCEAKVDASCSAEVECTGGEVSMTCEGKCEGSCSAECTVPSCTVTVEPGEANCEGSCQGSCSATLEAAASCEGKCEGSCSGECSAYVENASGDMECAGSCSGDCQGSCTLEGEAAVNCEGECKGECKLEGPSAEAACEGELGCSGECSGECTGGCEGEVKAPKCEGKAECNADVEAKCEAQASAQASASLECTPPSLEIDFSWGAGVDADGKAEVLAKLEKFKVAMVGIIQGWAELKALVETESKGDISVEPPVVTIKASAEAFLSDLKAGKVEVEAPGLVPCAIPAFEEAAGILGGIKNDVSGTISAQAELVALLKI